MALVFVGVVGSRKGVKQERVEQYLDRLHRKYPDAIIVSGDAKGVDTWAENHWLRLGGRVVSFRVLEKAPECFVAQELGLSKTRGGYSKEHEPGFADRTSALLFRNLLIVGKADRLVWFMDHPTPGTSFTKEIAERWEKIPTHAG